MTKKQINMAVQELKLKLLELFGKGIELRVLGSAARGDYWRHSDIWDTITL
jgi:predicted nucleotidyltransferase